MLVFDATPLIYLAKSEVLGKVKEIEERKVIPKGVYREVVTEGEEVGERDAVAVRRAVEGAVFEIAKAEHNELYRKLSDNPRLSDVDVQVIVLADREEGIAILDEEYGRTVAESEGIENRGTVYLLFRLLKNGKMEGEEIKEVVDRMIESGWYCSTDLYAKILEKIKKLESKG